MIPKFRAWLIQRKRMIELRGFKKFPATGNIRIYTDTTSPVIDKDDIILMQTTRLFDKNGVEIIEGDVVKLLLVEDDLEAISKVYSSYGCFGIWVEEEFVSFHTLMVESNIDYTLEILGNIHENPELIEHPDFRGENK